MTVTTGPLRPTVRYASLVLLIVALATMGGCPKKRQAPVPPTPREYIVATPPPTSAPAAGAGELKNSNFEAASDAMPDGWTRFPKEDAQMPGATVDVGPGRESSKGSLHIRSTSAEARGFVGATQVVGELPANQFVFLRGYVRGQNVDDCAVARLLFAYPASPELVMARTEELCLRGTSDWRAFEMLARIPEAVNYVSVFLGMRGTGEVWFDDVAIRKAEQETGEISYSPGIRNYSMEEGQFGWEEAILPTPRAARIYNRDTSAAHSGKASLRLHVEEQDSPESLWNFYQVLDARLLAGKKVRFSVWVKRENLDGVATIVLVPLTLRGELATVSSRGLKSGTQDWTQEKHEYEVPHDCLFLWVRLSMTGTGTVWFDDVALES